MKTIALTVLHYGKDYLGWAMQSVLPVVDEYWILYTDQGSHGHRTNDPCPETRDDLHRIATIVAGDKLRWVEGRWNYEGQQRDTIFELCPDADAVIVTDADEIWNEPHKALQQAIACNTRNNRVPMVHFWRSFHRCVINDPAFPVRIILPHGVGDYTVQTRPMAHFGYAMRPELVAYKWKIHGHLAEYRRGWLENTFLSNQQTDCHPTSVNYWNPVTVDPLDYMPHWMKTHPFFDKDVI